MFAEAFLAHAPSFFLSEMHFESNFHTETVILMLILAFLHDWAGWGWCGALVVEGLWG